LRGTGDRRGTPGLSFAVECDHSATKQRLALAGAIHYSVLSVGQTRGLSRPNMADYYAVLLRRIREINDDPVKMREVVYEAARLALRWQVAEQWQRFSIDESRHHVSELEEAIIRLETDAAGAGGPSNVEPGYVQAHCQSCDSSIEPEAAAASDVVEEAHPNPGDSISVEVIGLQAVARSLNALGIRETEARVGPQRANALPESQPNMVEPQPTRDLLSAKRADLGADAPPGGPKNHEPGEAVASLRSSRQSHNAAIKLKEDDAPPMVERSHPRHRSDPLPATQADAAQLGGRGNRRTRKAADSKSNRNAHSEPDEGDNPHTADEPDRWNDPLAVKPTDLEADAAGLGGRGNRERDKASEFKASRHRRNATVVPKEDDVPRGDEATLPQLRTPSGEQADPAGPRELILVPDQARRSTYLVTPAEFVDPEVTYRLSRAPRSGRRTVVYGLMIAFQLAIATLAVAAFYVAVWGRNSSVQAAKEMPVAAGQTTSEGVTAIAPPLTAAPVAAALPFPRPTDYGVYALHNNQLIELDSVQVPPGDPQARSQLQITQPARVVIDAAKLAFVAFRRDLVSSAPDKVPVRITARIARSMVFDLAGKPKLAKPATDTWLIREKGYDLRVSPLRESPEMVMLRPEDPEFLFPSGRYALIFGGQAYDFVVAGEVIDPAHCVEGGPPVVRPVFSECKQPP
jgi:hypothetical protein